MNDCIEWTGNRTGGGYGMSGGKLKHRTEYEKYVGPIPAGWEIDHLCKNPACYNPDHLEAVTPRENWRRSNAPSAVQARQTHCKRGHELAGENLYEWHGMRHCRACRKERMARRYRESR